MSDGPLDGLLDELARRHGDRAKVTVMVRAGRLPGGARIWIGDDLREVVAAIEREAGPWVMGTADGERERRLREALRQALERPDAVERFALSPGRHELPRCRAVIALLRERLLEARATARAARRRRSAGTGPSSGCGSAGARARLARDR